MHKYLNLVTKFLEVLTITLSLCCISSCKKEKGGYLDDAIAIAYKDDIPYLVNSKNQTFSLAEYDLIVPYFDDILIVQKNGLFGYIRKNGQVLLEPQYDEAYPFSEEKAVVRKNGTSFIINYAGKVLYTLENNYSSISSFSNNLLVISSSDSQGYLQYNPDIDGFQYLFNILETNEKGQTIVNHLPYDYCGKFTNNYAVVGFYNDNGEYKYSHINLKGNRLYDYEWDYASDFSNGYAVVGNTNVYKLKVYCDKERQFDSVIRENNNYRPLSDELSPVLAPRGNTVTLHLDENLTIEADPEKLARVFNNILKNAASYSFPHTEIVISAEKLEHEVIIRFQNSGEDIPNEALASLFNKFYRVDQSRSSDTGGTGLGLAIAKEIVTLHGGAISASSKNHVVTFTVSLPLSN